MTGLVALKISLKIMSSVFMPSNLTLNFQGNNGQKCPLNSSESGCSERESAFNPVADSPSARGFSYLRTSS
jgi:hypothetical protein